MAAMAAVVPPPPPRISPTFENLHSSRPSRISYKLFSIRSTNWKERIHHSFPNSDDNEIGEGKYTAVEREQRDTPVMKAVVPLARPCPKRRRSS